jgi:hydrogenase maturation protease
VTAPNIAIVGIGNLLLSDDGVGIHAIRELRAEGRVEAAARVIDGGTVGTDLLAEVCGCGKLLIIDAVDVGLPPGAAIWMDLSVPGPREIYTRNAHQAGIEGLLDDLRLMGCNPGETILLGVQPGSLASGTQLSAEVAAALPAVLGQVLRQVERWCSGAGMAMSASAEHRSPGAPAQPWEHHNGST